MGNPRWRLLTARTCVLIPVLWLSAAFLEAGFNRSKIPQIACGKTTAAELERLIGKPKNATDNSDGSWTWVYQEGKFVPSVIFTVQVSPAGVVDTYSLQELNVGFGSIFKSKKVDPATLGKIRDSETTEAQVEALLGQPMMKVTNSDGSKMYSYVYENTGTGQKESRAILFDRTGVVTTALGGQVDGPKKGRPEPIDEKRWALLAEGRSTEQEVVELLGPPQSRGDMPDGTHSLMYWTSRSLRDFVYYSVQVGGDGLVVGLSRAESHWDEASQRMMQGRKIDPAQWRQIQPGVTTDADILEWFGPPSMIMPRPDGRKTYVYQYREGNSMLSLLSGQNHSVGFDPRGIVSNAAEEALPSGLEVRPADAAAAARWTAWESERPAGDAVRQQAGEPARAIAVPDGGSCWLYLYEAEASSFEGFWLDADAAGAWAGLARTRWTLRELNARGRAYNRARWQSFHPGQTTAGEIETLLGPPAHRTALAGGGSLWLYVAGEVMLLPPSGMNLQSRQIFNLCALRFDAAGVLQSFQAD
jgi:outer membrane protein assembly factor BamE (lipoprotein component of BamABCDE complex)